MGVAHVLIPQQSHTCSIEITGLSAVTTTARRSDRSLAAKTGVDPLRRASGVSGIQVCKLSLLSLRGGYVVSSIGCAHAVKCALRLAPCLSSLPLAPPSPPHPLYLRFVMRIKITALSRHSPARNAAGLPMIVTLAVVVSSPL
jgi:hypothetical protein